MAFIGRNVEVNTNTLTPQSADPTVPTEGMLFYADGTSRPEGVYVYKNGNWVLVGSGTGELNFYEHGNADEASVSDFTTGNNATFDGGGSFQGAFTISTTAADLISGDRVFKLVLNATPGTSDDDYVASTVVDIPQGYRGRFLAVKLQYKYDGADSDIKWVVKDDTNTEILTVDTEVLNQFDEVNNVATEFTLSFLCPGDCEQIKIGPQVVTHATGSEELIWDDVVVTPNVLVNGQISEIQNIKVNTANGFGSSGTKIRRFTNEEYNNGSEILTYTQDATNGDFFTVNTACEVEIAVSDNFGAANDFGVSLNASSLSTNFGALAVSERLIQASTTAVSISGAVSWHGSLVAGDVLRVHSQGSAGGTAANTLCSILAVKRSDAFIAYNTHSKNSMIKIHTGNGYGSTNTVIKRFLTVETSTGTAITYADSSTLGSTFTINETGIYHISYTGASGAISTTGISLNSTELTTAMNGLVNVEDRLASETNGGNQYTVSLSWAGILQKGDIVRPHNDGSSGTETRESFAITRIGSNQLLGVPKTLTAYIKDAKSSGTGGGSFTSGSYQTRDLNTLEGDTSFVSLSSNQITLDPGTYDFYANSPSFRVSTNKARLRDITNSVTTILGSAEFGETAGGGTLGSNMEGRLVLTETTTFEIQHRCNFTQAFGFGSPSSYGEDEIYTVVRITKLN